MSTSVQRPSSSSLVTMQGESGEMPPPPAPSDKPEAKEDKVAVERREEQKLRAKYPQGAARGIPGAGGPNPIGGGAGGGGHSAFLQKRLAKGQKYFDSGDYQMAKQRPRGLGMGIGGGGPAAAAAAAAASAGRPVVPALAMPPPTGETIPTPELVPARKTSIIQPVHDLTQSMHLPSDPAHVTVPEPGKPMPNPAVSLLK